MRKLPQKYAIKSARINKLEAELKRKNMHGQFAKYLDQPHVHKERSNQWLKSSTLKRFTESIIAVIQEQALSTKYIKNMSSMLKMMIHVKSAVSKKKPSTSYLVVMVFHRQNISNAMITSVNTFMFSCYWNMDLSRNKLDDTNTNQHKWLKITQQKSCGICQSRLTMRLSITNST